MAARYRRLGIASPWRSLTNQAHRRRIQRAPRGDPPPGGQQAHFPVMVTVLEAEPGSAWLGDRTILVRLPPFAFGVSVREPDPLGVFDPPALHVSSGVPLGELTARVTSSG